MSRAAIILRNITSNWIGFAFNAVATLVLTPIVLRHLGAAGYGIWILSSSVIGYYGFLDLGFRAGVTQYLTRYLASGDSERASECMSSAVAALGAMGVFLMLLSIGAAWLVPHIFHLPPELLRDAFWCVLIVGISAGLQFALSPFTSIFAATQRFDLANLIGIVTRLLTVAGVVLALRAGHGLIGLSVVTCAVSLVDYLARWLVSRRLAVIKLSRAKVSLASVKEISAFGVWNFLISLNAFVYQHVPNMLIGVFMPVAAIGYYALAVGLARQITSALSPIGQVVYPAAAALDVQGDRAGLERLYHDGSRLLQLAMISVTVLAGFWAEDFYRLWVGEAYLSGAEYPSVAVLFQFMLVATATTFSSIGAQILMGAGHVRLVAVTLICGSVLNMCLSLTLIGPYGLLGVAFAAALGGILIDLLTMPLLVQKYLRLPASSFLRRAWPRPLLVAVLQMAVALLIRQLGQPANWFELAAQGGLAAAACAAIVVLCGATPTERQRFIFQPWHRLVGGQATRAS